MEITSRCKGIYPSYWMTRVIDQTRNFEIETDLLFVQVKAIMGFPLCGEKMTSITDLILKYQVTDIIKYFSLTEITLI